MGDDSHGGEENNSEDDIESGTGDEEENVTAYMSFAEHTSGLRMGFAAKA